MQSPPTSEPEFEFLSENAVEPLTNLKLQVYADNRTEFLEYLRTRGKNPERFEGYAESSVPAISRRVHQVFEFIWKEETTLELTPQYADSFVDALVRDEFTRSDGDAYSEGSKRKFVDALEAWVEWRDIEWEPSVTFQDEPAKDAADPFTKDELRLLWETALEYKNIPDYSNLSSEDRESWKIYLSQELGKPKIEISPSDWDRVNQCWHVPSLIRTTRSSAWRPCEICILKIQWYDPQRRVITIPAEYAAKNDVPWEQQLTDQGAHSMNRWLEQRSCQEKYEGRDEIWLNREGNPYNSGSLNRLLNNLVEAAGINNHNRKLTWYSFRHSKGTYVFEETGSLKMVATALRQTSTQAAARYVTPTSEIKSELARIC